ncbi:N-acetylneuraminate synthase family protein [Catenovulum adriaticum]|uniref:N-acetylneuraminate synthase family protein n=1 Tax=Catenovulum adriaticum TaxID=2984846 RepID=A0ABY7ANG2_9ALTE|nr:N-acetylneuraminate synthase family protein [Catenovulum sp. TS8]WAJ71049.1 N-acetylneuraminate synthase family protein [Catenovulum sp. TS8]
MVKHRNLLPFVVEVNAKLSSALKKIEQNKHKLVFVVDEKNVLVGCIADGDYRRWSLTQPKIDLSVPVNQVMNSNCISFLIDTPTSQLERFLAHTAKVLPLVDQVGHLVEILESGGRFFDVNGRRISEEDPCFIIAEVGNNHQGDLKLAKRLIDLAKETGADCVKFQMRDMQSLYGNEKHDEQDLGAQYTLDLLEKYQLSDDELIEVFDYAKSIGLLPLCTPWDMESLNKLEQYGMPAYKVASADFTNFQLLEAIAKTGKPMFCSTGMSSEDEILKTVSFLKRQQAQYILLHCNSTYPTPFKDVHLNYLNRLKPLSNGVVGYSGHERGFFVPIAAVAMGCKVIEKHFTTDKSLQGNDHQVSLLPEEFSKMVKDIRDLEIAMGHSEERTVSQGELMNREVLAKSLVATHPIEKGQIIKPEFVAVKSPGKGIQPNRINELVGKTAYRSIRLGECFFETDITGENHKKENYQFDRPYGIPARYHDFTKLTSEVALDFVEFHLSYQDLELELSNYLPYCEHQKFAVHTPELFQFDHLLDLASDDMAYRGHSIYQLQRVIEHVNKVKKFFPNNSKPVLVLNAGGWSKHGFLSECDKQRKYGLVADALKQIDHSSVTIAIQTMPPYPWHFGGQSYHNLFVLADEIKQFCIETNLNICLDISHSMMACNYNGHDLNEFIAKIADKVVHLHVSDALGVDGEGIQIGEGDVNFSELAASFNSMLPNVQFIPEIWQGHKNHGEGFWQALSYLEQKFNNRLCNV